MASSELSGFEAFCGGPIWNRTLTWDTNDPDFTACFQKSVLSWTPGLIILLYGPYEAYEYTKSVNRNIPFNWLNLSKILLTILAIAVSLSEVVLTAVNDDADVDSLVLLPPPDIDYVTPVLFALMFLASLMLLLMSLRYGVQTSAAQVFFYFTAIISWAPIFRSLILKQNGESDQDFDAEKNDRLCLIFGLQYFASVALLLLQVFSDARPRVYDERIARLSKPCPQIEASFISKLFYSWSDRLLWSGYRKPLEPSDLWDVHPKLTSRGVVPVFDKHYERAVEVAEKAGKPHSVYPALFYTFGPMFFVGSALKMVYDVLAMVAPQIMKVMIAYVETYAMGGEDYAWKGYFYAGLLLFTTCVQSLMLSQYFEKMFIVGMDLRTAMISLIYRKSLRMSGAARKESTVGESVNLMSVDVQRFMDLLPYLNMLWSAPLQIALCCYFIYIELGYAMFAGLAIMILAVPINAVLASLTRKLQLEQMKNKDQRVKLMNEILSGVKVLKLYGWEQSFMDQVLGIRSKEIVVLKKTAYLGAGISFIWITVPFLVALGCFATYIFMDGGNVLDPKKAFVTLSYLNIMRMPMSILPMMIIGLVQVGVSLDRINKYMNNEELQDDAVDRKGKTDEAEPIAVEKGTFRWGKTEPVILEDISLRLRKGTLTAVVGTVGTGKSSLVSALLGEMDKESGSVRVSGRVAYVPQQAWMQNTSLENNILFGQEGHEARYQSIIDACALRSDIAILPGGDQTEIGEKGINLSGGQKQRVSLARAVYSDADVYLLDDPLSAVDSHVGKHIFENVIGDTGILKGKTRVLVTHGITYLPKTDYIIVLKAGRISEQGTYQELVERKGAFAEFLLEYMSEQGTENDEAIEEIKHKLEESLGKDEVQKELSRQTSRVRKDSVLSNGSEHHRPLDASPTSVTELLMRQRSKTMSESSAAQIGKPMLLNALEEEEKKKKQNDEQKASPGAKLIEREVAQTGSVKMSVYGYYMKNIGWVGVAICLFMQIVYQATSIGTNVWLNVWTNETLGSANETKYRDLYLGVYGGLGLAQSVATLILTICLAITTLNASKKMHKSMLDSVMRSPMSFFDTTPVGRIVNRFAKDVDVCDNTLPSNLRQWLNTFASFVATVVLIISVIPLFAAVIVPTAILFFFIQGIYVNTSRQLKRLESISRSPIYSHFGETVTGASTIRAFGLQELFITDSERKVDANQVSYYPSIISNRWLAVRLEFIGNFITFSAAIFAILDPGSIDPSEVGLIISYALNVTQTLNWLVRMTSDVETNIVAVERVKEYSTELTHEATWEHGKTKPDKEWPKAGEVEFKDYGMRYRPNLDLVIHGLSCNIRGGETVGIVGRTGAGKSSLTVALFRLVEAAQGRIFIDGVDIADIGLHDLRKKLTIIPQDPVLFSGTLRINLDPFETHSDKEVWKVLELAHLKYFVTSLEDGLQHEVSEGGENVSVGQRQLICLARALLRKTKVLILDEATAAVDLETDDLIQATIRKEFQGCTVITIAHRLNTILDYDRIMVLDQGRIIEFDSPDKLLADSGSHFYGMAKDANLV